MASHNDQAPLVPALKEASIVIPLSLGSSVANGPRLDVSAAGGDPVECMVDTGSTGAVFGYSLLKGLKDADITKEHFQLSYWPSGNTYWGVYMWTELTLYDSSSGEPKAVGQTAKMRVRKVDKFYDGTTKKTYQYPDAIKTAMLGIGFDRDEATKCDPGGFPYPKGLNPFLQLQQMAEGTMTRGYIIGLQTPCLTLGLTPQNTQGFRFLQLQRQINPPHETIADWAAPNIWMSVPSAGIAPMKTSLLIDTGLGSANVMIPTDKAPPLITVRPRGELPWEKVANGQHIVLAAEAEGAPFYSFEVGSRDAPEWVAWESNAKLLNGISSINTGRHALSQSDYLFDDDNGRLGFRSLA